jgi:6-pyruvoyl-tetrahydropterin synthase related domain
MSELQPDAAARHARRGPSRWLECLGAVSLYAFLAIAVMAPLASSAVPHTGAEDLANHLSGIVEARNALAEGQFPVRVAPKQHDGERYPIFQFYGNLPYTAGAVLYMAGLNPYQAWRGVMGGALVLGAFFTYLGSRSATRRHWPALVAGAVFMTAPYAMCDLHGRVAYSETVSLGLLPLVFFCLQRTLIRPRLGTILAGAATWSFLALSHAITYFCASWLLGLYVLSYMAWSRKFLRRALAALAAHVLGVGLTAWYLAPQLDLLPELAGGLAFPVGKTAWLTPLSVLLAPTIVPPVHLPTPFISSPMHFGLQVGWPILAALIVALRSLFTRAGGTFASRGPTFRLSALVVLALFLAWTPFDFWQHLPGVFEFVQFSYRVLMFVVVFGALLAAHALQLIFRDGMRFEHALGCLLGLGVFVAPYLQPHQSEGVVDLDQEIARPNIGRGGANGVYLLSLAHIHEHMHQHPCPPDFAPVWARETKIPMELYPGQPARLVVHSPGKCFIELPVLYYPRVLDVRLDGQRVPYYSMAYHMALPFTFGRHELAVRFVGLRWANWLSALLWICLTTSSAGLLWRSFRAHRRLDEPSYRLAVWSDDPTRPRRAAA